MDYLTNLSIKHFKVFFAVAKHNNFTLAAEEMYTTQATVSRIIGQIESAVGTPLFVRNKYGVTINEAGKQLATEWRWAVSAMENSTRMIRSKYAFDENLIIGDISTADSFTYLIPILDEFTMANANVSLKVEKISPLEIVDGVMSGNLNGGFLSIAHRDMFCDSNVEMIDVIHLDESMVIAKGNALFEVEDLDYRELAKQPLVAIRYPMEARWLYVKNIYERLNLEIPEVIFVDNPATLGLELMRRSCVALMDKTYVPCDRKWLRYIDLPTPKMESGMMFVYRKDVVTPTLDKFICAVKRFADSNTKTE